MQTNIEELNRIDKVVNTNTDEFNRIDEICKKRYKGTHFPYSYENHPEYVLIVEKIFKDKNKKLIVGIIERQKNDGTSDYVRDVKGNLKNLMKY